MVRELGFMQASWAPVGIPHPWVHVLLEVDRHGPSTGQALSDALRIDKGAISRTLAKLIDEGLLEPRVDPTDRRRRPVYLTANGEALVARMHAAADAQVGAALDLASPVDRRAILDGMAAYARTLRRARLTHDLVLRPIQAMDDPQVKALIEAVMPEFGASGPGFAIHDPEVQAMSQHYVGARARYFVILRDNRVVGGAGFAPLDGGDPTVCELRKMYFLPELRGLGMGARMLRHVLEAAAAAGFLTCYLETLESMHGARKLYGRFGFEQLDRPLGATGHFGCDAWYARPLPLTE
jgi:putative acetyltransferase